MMLEEILDGLPPKQDIYHHNDLIPRASLQNLSHYKINPKEDEILKGKVDKILC